MMQAISPLKSLEIEGVIFDMDGLLLDSEPFWLAAEVEIYQSLGIDLKKHMTGATTGLRVDAAVQYWFERFPWQGTTVLEVQNAILDRVESLILAGAKPKRGAIELVRKLSAANIPLAVCSSSPLRLIHVALTKIGIMDAFQVLQSAENEVHGKPHPAAYLSTAARLKRAPTQLLVFEDSLLGAIAGKAARMKVIAVPEGDGSLSTRFDFCDGKIPALDHFDVDYFIEHRVLKNPM